MTDAREIAAGKEVHQEHVDGYFDGYNLDAPMPSDNRHPRYIHSFIIGRAEKTKTGLPSLARITRSLALLDSDPFADAKAVRAVLMEGDGS